MVWCGAVMLWRAVSWSDLPARPAPVGQCIGRAIRHVGDYAAIILIDQRYQTESVRGKIAGWIRKRLSPVPHLTSTLSTLTCII